MNNKVSDFYINKSYILSFLITLSKAIGAIFPFLFIFAISDPKKLDLIVYVYGIFIFLMNIPYSTIEKTTVPIMSKLGNNINYLFSFFILYSIPVLMIQILLIIIFFNFEIVSGFGELYFFIPYGLILFFIGPYITISSNIFSGKNNQKGNYYIAPISLLIRNFVLITVFIFTILFFKIDNFYSLIISLYVAEIIRLIWLIIKTLKFISKDKILSSIKKVGRTFYSMAFFPYLTSIMLSLNAIIDRTMISKTNFENSISMYFYADRIQIVLFSIITAGFLIKYTTFISSNDYSKNNTKLLVKNTIQTLSFITALSILFILFMNFMNQYLNIINVNLLQTFSIILITLILCFIPNAIAGIYERNCIKFGYTKYIFFASIVVVFFKIILNVFFIKWFDIYGPAITSIIISFLMCLIIFSIYKNIRI